MDESRLCASCKTRPVAGKRKDAIYCTDPKCRKDAHLKRKEQAAQLPPTLSANKSSLIITFPDGRRCLIELTLLDSVAPSTLPSLTQVPNTPTENGSGSTLVQAEPTSGVEGSGQIQTDQILHSLVQQTALPTSLQDAPDQIQNRLPESAPTSAPSVNAQSGQPDSHSASTSTDIAPSAFVPTAPQDAGRAGASVTSQVRTVELYFVDEAGRVLTFEKAVRRREDLSWRLKWHAKAMLGFSPSEGHGLGGRPGRWRDTYRGKAPTEFGLEQDIGVLYYDAATDRRSAAPPELLMESFGPGWRELVRRSAGRIP